MRRTNKKGFTIVELVIVIAVIAVLAAVLIPTFASLVNKAHESTDIQAVKNMNTYLAAEKATDGINSILDVYDVFEESDYSVENYAPLYKGRSFWYSKEDNMIVYVDDATQKVLFPASLENTLKGDKSWYSLDMKGVTGTKPSEGNYTVAEASRSGQSVTNAKITATVANAAEYKYVIDAYNEKIQSSQTYDMDLTISGTIDMMGSSCTIESIPQGAIVTIKAGTNGGTLKNITSVSTFSTSTGNEKKLLSEYDAAGLVAANHGTLTIEGITVENINVRTIMGGNVALLVGANTKLKGQAVAPALTIKNVTIKDSTVIAHRNAGALVGLASGDGTVTVEGTNTLTNVSVKTIGGRSALYVGLVEGKASLKMSTDASITHTNSSLSIYECDAADQTFLDTTTDGAVAEASPSKPSKYINSYKGHNETSGELEKDTYPYFEDALVLQYNKDNNAEYFIAITDNSKVTGDLTGTAASSTNSGN